MLLRDGLGPGFEVFSRGTHALVGHGIEPAMGALLTELGHDPSTFVAQRLNPRRDTHADLILTATRAHRSLVVQQAPLALRRTFTLPEFARLVPEAERRGVDGTGPERLRSFVRAVGDSRTPPTGAEDDIVDPYRLDEQVFRTSLRQITDAVDVILRAVSG